MFLKNKFLYLFLLSGLALLNGCAAIQPFPNTVRAGDTITLAIGSLDGATKNNTTITYYADSDPSTPIDLTPNIRSVFKLYPDKTSLMVQLGDTNAIPGWSGHGAWQTVVALDIPLESFAGIPFPEGTGIISVSMGAEVVYPNNSVHVDNVQINMEILPGEGSPHVFEYFGNIFLPSETGNLAQLQSVPQVLVRPSVVSGTYPGQGNNYGAIEYILDVPVVNAFGGSVDDNALSVILDEQMGYIDAQLQVSWVKNGDEVKVMMISPKGKINSKLVRFSLIMKPFYQYTYPDTPTLTSARYFDIDGVEVSDSTVPEILLVQ